VICLQNIACKIYTAIIEVHSCNIHHHFLLGQMNIVPGLNIREGMGSSHALVRCTVG